MSHSNNYTQPMHAPQHNPNLHYRPNRDGAPVGPPGSGPPARSGPSISQKGLQSQRYEYRGQGYGESSARDRDTPLGAPGSYSQADLVLKYSGDDEEESLSSFSSLSNPNPAGAGSRRSVGNYGGLRDHGALTITAPRPPLASGGGPASNSSISSADGSRTESPLNVPLRISPGLKIDVPISPGGLGSGGLDSSSHNSKSSIGSLGKGQSQGQGQGQGQGQSYQSYHY